MLHRARDLALALLAATLLALLPGACASSGPRDLPPEAVLEVRFVETDPALPTTGFPWQGVDLPPATSGPRPCGRCSTRP